MSHEIHVITGDRDLGDKTPFAGVPVGLWAPIGSAAVLRVPPRFRSMVGPVRHASADKDLIYLNSMFSPVFSLFPLFAHHLGAAARSPVLLAPRGELAAAALGLKSHKKRPVSWLLRKVLRNGRVVWHASSEREAADIRNFMTGTDVRIVVRANPAPVPQKVSAPATQPLTIVFLGRMVRIKNFEQIVAAAGRTSMRLNIIVAGNVEDVGYWRRCEAQVAALSNRVTVTVGGHLSLNQVHSALRSADAMVLPTRGENFGHAIAEAMAVGCPVMIPDTTMWTPLVEAGAGWTIDTDDPHKLAQALRELDSTGPEARLRRRQQVSDLYTQWWVSQEQRSPSLFDDALKMLA